MKRRRTTSFVLSEDETGTIDGPWCKFCQWEFERWSAEETAEAFIRIVRDGDCFPEWQSGLVQLHACAAWERHHGKTRPAYWWKTDEERISLAALRMHPAAPSDAPPASGVRFGAPRFFAPVYCPGCGHRFTAGWGGYRRRGPGVSLLRPGVHCGVPRVPIQAADGRRVRDFRPVRVITS